MLKPFFTRPAWHGVLARAGCAGLVACLERAPVLPGFMLLRGPESGMSMVRGCVGGGGAVFNVGELTLSRCSVRDEGGRVGHGYAVGCDLGKVELVARLDAVLQDAALYWVYHEAVLVPLAAAELARRGEIEVRAAATEVKFFTMAAMRG